MAVGECLVYSSLQTTQKSSLSPGLRVGGHQALTDFRSEDTKWTPADDSTLNIVLGIIIIIIIIIIKNDVTNICDMNRLINWGC